jgi:hypothetical protein
LVGRDVEHPVANSRAKANTKSVGRNNLLMFSPLIRYFRLPFRCCPESNIIRNRHWCPASGNGAPGLLVEDRDLMAGDCTEVIDLRFPAFGDK